MSSKFTISEYNYIQEKSRNCQYNICVFIKFSLYFYRNIILYVKWLKCCLNLDQ